MPYNYTHHRFGKELIAGLPGPQRQCVNRFRRMFDMGLHGPDIFFYHNPFWKNRQSDLGHAAHAQSGRDFFPKAFAAARSEAARAYLLGLLAHYCLDSHCHPYINQLDAIGEARHIALESEWDRYWMERDGIPSPHTYDMSKRFHLTRGECISVAAFYPGATPGSVAGSVRFMAFAARFFARGNQALRKELIQRIQPKFCDFFLPAQAVEGLYPYILELTDRYHQALAAYPLLLAELLEHKGENLGEAFAPIFG